LQGTRRKAQSQNERHDTRQIYQVKRFHDRNSPSVKFKKQERLFPFKTLTDSTPSTPAALSNYTHSALFNPVAHLSITSVKKEDAAPFRYSGFEPLLQ
jgi:hypothetical protein